MKGYRIIPAHRIGWTTERMAEWADEMNAAAGKIVAVATEHGLALHDSVDRMVKL